VSGESVLAGIGRGEALMSVSATRSLSVKYSRPAARRAHHREHHARDARDARRRLKPAHISARSAYAATAEPSASIKPWAALALAMAAALALAAGLRRRVGAR
jgi:hypothetical protein